MITGTTCINGDVISMPDKWEYPWYAAWDLAFHVLPLTLVDPDFGKQQLQLMLREHYMHPNGQIPAYEWNFGDVNPPVHAWSTIFTYRLEKAQSGQGDKEWLKSSFQKLLLNFTWWVNRKDRSGRNVFEGGFLGLDNIGVFDRSAPLPTGGYLEQADGTAWMALFCQNMLEIAVELAHTEPDYVDMAHKFCQHFLWIASAMAHAGDDTGMWDEEDGFFYDVLRLPSGEAQQLKVRSMVGLLPLCAATTFDGDLLAKNPEIRHRFERFLNARPELFAAIHDPTKPGIAGRHLASILDETKLRRVLAKMLDENEFLSPFGIRSLSRYHATHPYVVHAGGQEYRVSYLPAESDTGMFGGNSNWRGPIWMPVNALIIRALLQYYLYYGDDFTVECPTGSGRRMTLYQVAEEIARRLVEYLPEGRRWPTGPSTAEPGSSRRTRTGEITSCSTSISTATTGRAWAPAIKLAGRESSPGPCTSSRPSHRSRPWSVGRKRISQESQPSLGARRFTRCMIVVLHRAVPVEWRQRRENSTIITLLNVTALVAIMLSMGMKVTFEVTAGLGPPDAPAPARTDRQLS